MRLALSASMIVVMTVPGSVFGAISLSLAPQPIVLSSGNTVNLDLRLMNPDAVAVWGVSCRVSASEPGLMLFQPLSGPITQVDNWSMNTAIVPPPWPMDPPGAPIVIGGDLGASPVSTDALLASFRVLLPDPLASAVRSGSRTVTISLGSVSVADIDFNEYFVTGIGTTIIPEPMTVLMAGVGALCLRRRR